MLKYFDSVKIISLINWSGTNLTNHRQTPAWLNRWSCLYLRLTIAFLLWSLRRSRWPGPETLQEAGPDLERLTENEKRKATLSPYFKTRLFQKEMLFLGLLRAIMIL